MKTALITGITGQDGAYLSQLLLDKKYKVVGLSRSKSPDLKKLRYLGIDKKILVLTCNALDFKSLQRVIRKIKPDEIYNLAGQSSVNYSFTHPVETIRDNTISVLNLLESIRMIDPKIKMYQASTSEMYGNRTEMPITEKSIIDPSNPYGVSKAAGHLMVRNYRETFGLFCVSGIVFNHESHLRAPEYFIRKLIRTAIKISNGSSDYVYLGQLHNTRDFGYSPKYVEAMWRMLQQKKPADFIICSGKPISVKKITEYVLKKFDVPLSRIKIDKNLFRYPNVPNIYGDNARAKKVLGWRYDMSFFETLDILIDEELRAQQAKR